MSFCSIFNVFIGQYYIHVFAFDCRKVVKKTLFLRLPSLQIVKTVLTRTTALALGSGASRQGTAWTPRRVATVATTAQTGPMRRDAQHQVQMKMTATSGRATSNGYNLFCEFDVAKKFNGLFSYRGFSMVEGAHSCTSFKTPK